MRVSYRCSWFALRSLPFNGDWEVGVAREIEGGADGSAGIGADGSARIGADGSARIGADGSARIGADGAARCKGADGSARKRENKTKPR